MNHSLTITLDGYKATFEDEEQVRLVEHFLKLLDDRNKLILSYQKIIDVLSEIRKEK